MLKSHPFKILLILINKLFLIAAFLFFYQNTISAQKVLGDCTIYYSVVYKDKDSIVILNAQKTVFIHGSLIRTDFANTTNNYLQTIIQNNRTGVVNVLKEIGNNKYKTTLDSVAWKTHNSLYNNMKTSLYEDDVKVILGYRCAKALMTLENGAKYEVYYTLDVVPSSKENKYQFKDIPGIVLQYESIEDSNASPVVIKAKSINLMPIANHLFNIPIRGYRVSNDF